jgi:CelD/BcsL family acetyltransferase involved in cellulose biosynthesis
MTSSGIRKAIKFSIEPLPPLEALGNTWTRLDAVGAHSFFVTWPWIGTWLRCLPHPPQTMLLRATQGDETVGLAVLTLKRSTRRGISVKQAWLNTTGDPAYDCITIEHNGFASSDVGIDELWAAFGDWVSGGVPAADEFVLNAVDHQVPFRASNQLTTERSDSGYRTPLANFSTLEGFISSLSRNSRQQLRRSIRAYERSAPLSIEIAKDSQRALEFFAQMKLLHVRSWTRRQHKHAFDSPFFETFHRSLIRRGAGSGSVHLVRVSAGDRAIGYLYNFLRDGTVSSYQSGFEDTEKRLRPGYVCHALAIAHYAATGMTYYDFLGGANGLKQSFAPEQYTLFWPRLRARTLPLQVEGKIREIWTTLRKRENKASSGDPH